MRGGMGRWVFACLIMVVMAPGVATAAGPGEPVDDPSLTPAVAEKWKQATEQKDAEIAASSAAARASDFCWHHGGSGRLAGVRAPYSERHELQTGDVVLLRSGFGAPEPELAQEQERLGDRAAITGHTGGKMGTTTSGSLTTGIARALNSYNGKFGTVNYVASNITDTGNPTSAFYTRIGWMLQDARTVPIILTSTARIPRYNGHSSRHYMSVSGINDLNSAITMRSVDPNSNALYRGVYWDAMGSQTSNGLCRATYQADVDGSNMAMRR